MNIFKEIDELQKRIDAHRPLPSNLLQSIKEYYRIGLTYSSNALEGNSLTETETKVVLEDGITIGGKRLIDHFEAIGHSDAYNFLWTLVKNETITQEDIKRLHHLFYFRIDEANAGVYRTVHAFITGSKYPLPSPQAISDLMDELVLKIEKMRKQNLHPVELAARVHKEFVFIHPFVDGNGRVARLLMNLVLLQEGYEIVIIPPVVRSEYIRLLEKAHEDEKEFILFNARMAKEIQQDYIRLFLAA